MFCPKCTYEYIDDLVQCPDCGTDLVSARPRKAAPARQPDLALVTILETGNQFLIARVKSILDEAGIPYLAKGEGLQDLFGLGRIGAGYNQIVGPVQLQVRNDQEQLARRLLEEIDTAVPDDAETGAP